MSFVINSNGATSMEQKLTSGKISSWIKFTASTWVDGNSSDAEFISAIQFLITEGTMIISN
ncbi:MAG: hypothetical protein HRO68_08245 [Nitrosopumilus sp.]|nr:hypothetical protein [Nitrosopumilus sp.]